MRLGSELIEYTALMGEKKINRTLRSKAILGFAGGALIALGFLACIRIGAAFQGNLQGIGSFLGASVFPVGLIIIIIAGGELFTGNIMVVSMAFFDKKVTIKEMLVNWVQILLFNAVGAIFVAYFLAYLTGLLTEGIFLEQTLRLAEVRVNQTFIQAFLSGIGCNWFVSMAVYLSYASKDTAGKVLAAWFPVMTFVLIGFQHSVANLFLLPLAVFLESFSWLDVIMNAIPVILGNIIGGAIFVSALYYYSKD
ncbi:formate/nitrite transporter family protein [Aerococcaceae bacterium WGS1372]